MLRLVELLIRVLNGIRSKLNKPSASSPEYISAQRAKKWFEDKGDETLRLDYDLNSHSVVFDIGGYKGEFAAQMICKYDCTVYIFEPIPEFYKIIKNKFFRNKNVIPFCYGLSDKTASQKISLTDNSSSFFIEDSNSLTIQTKNIVEFIQENNIEKIDLAKINIEGAEYALLESIIHNNLIHKFKNIQVQFHDFIIDDAKNRMERIQSNLSKTHILTYQYPFIWENWKLKD